MEEETKNFIRVIKEAKQALSENNSLKLKDLSNQTIHSASTLQDTDSITIAILIYSLSKLIERKDHFKIKSWGNFVKKLNSSFSLALKSLKDNKPEQLRAELETIRKTISSISPNLKPVIQDVIRKASINKAAKIYEHGISMEQTAKLLGITQWELSEYAGQTGVSETNYNKTSDIKERVKMALEFFA